MDNIKDILNNVVQQISQNRGNRQKNVELVFDQILKEDEKKNLKLEGERDGILHVTVGSSAWLYQMNTRKNSLLEKMRKELPDITDIKFILGTIHGQK